jgi:hypothetical protein
VLLVDEQLAKGLNAHQSHAQDHPSLLFVGFIKMIFSRCAGPPLMADVVIKGFFEGKYYTEGVRANIMGTIHCLW